MCTVLYVQYVCNIIVSSDAAVEVQEIEMVLKWFRVQNTLQERDAVKRFFADDPLPLPQIMIV